MGLVRKIAVGAHWVWRRIADLGTLAWLWPGSAAVAAGGLAMMEGLPLALWFVFAIAGFCFALVAVILWQEIRGAPVPVAGALARQARDRPLAERRNNSSKHAVKPRPGRPLEALHRGLAGRAGPRPIPKRDTPLADAVAYACTGVWDGAILESLFTDQTEFDDFNYRKREMEKEFAADGLTVWGRECVLGMAPHEYWEIIEPEFWTKNKIGWDNLILGGPSRTESRSGFGNDDQYEDLMVSKAEVEDRWPA